MGKCSDREEKENEETRGMRQEGPVERRKGTRGATFASVPCVHSHWLSLPQPSEIGTVTPFTKGHRSKELWMGRSIAAVTSLRSQMQQLVSGADLPSSALEPGIFSPCYRQDSDAESAVWASGLCPHLLGRTYPPELDGHSGAPPDGTAQSPPQPGPHSDAPISSLHSTGIMST